MGCIRPFTGLALGLLLLATACGYHFAGRAIGLPSHVQRIAIPVFENATFEPRIEDVITQTVVNEFILDGRLKVVPEASADAVLYGKIVSYEQVPLAFDSSQRVLQYRIRMRLDLRLEDRKTGKALWKETGLVTRPTRAEYTVVPDVDATKANKDEAIARVSKDLAEDLVSRILEAF